MLADDMILSWGGVVCTVACGW